MDFGTHAIEDTNPHFFNTLLDNVKVALNINPYCLQDVNGTAGRGKRPGAVLGQVDAAGGGNDGSGGADIKGLERIHTGAAVFNQRFGHYR